MNGHSLDISAQITANRLITGSWVVVVSDGSCCHIANIVYSYKCTKYAENVQSLCYALIVAISNAVSFIA